MNISFFVRKDYQTIQAYSGTQSIRGELVEHAALVVNDEDNNPVGVLTAMDVVQNPHNLVIDCLTKKSSISPDCSIEEAILIMQLEQTDVLPVYIGTNLEGLVFKNDLLKFMSDQKKELEVAVDRQIEEIHQINQELKVSRQVMQAIFDSTDSIIFLVDPDFRIIFFNKKARDSSKFLYRKELVPGANILDYAANNGERALQLFKSSFEKALGGETIVSEREMPFPGKTFWIRTEYTPVYDGDTIIGVSMTISDIDEEKKQILQIEKQNDLLKRISWMQSHQTRQPVATILGLINILDKTSLARDNREIIDLLEITVQKLDEVIRNTVIIANSADGSDHRALS